MKIAFSSIHKFERDYIIETYNNKHGLLFLGEVLFKRTVELAKVYMAIWIFVADKLTAIILKELYAIGIRCIFLRLAG